MTRINLVNPSELKDQHLIAEYREITMIPAALNRTLNSKIGLRREKISKKYTLNSGHVYFFYDKGEYLYNRYRDIIREMKNRGFKPDINRKFPTRIFIDNNLYNDWMPTLNDLKIIRKRISEKIAMKPSWYNKTKSIITKPLILMFFFLNTLSSQNLDLFEKEIFIQGKDTLNYRVLKPQNYDSEKSYPLHLFLHGAGERGNDNELQLVHGAKLFLKKENREKYKSWVIFPQSPKNDWWGGYYSPYEYDYQVEKSDALGLVIKLMDHLVNRKDVDKDKVYISGLSMGGLGTFSILNQRPNMFAAATPICGDGGPNSVDNFAKKVNIWIFHGSADKVVHPNQSLKMAQAIINAGGNPKVTIYENVEHNSWDVAFAEKDFLKWIHSKTKKK